MAATTEMIRDFRAALGNFATGVTIVTTVDGDNEPVGVTASSFNSVSLDPPLVLWSLAKSAKSREAFCSSGHFAIHILTAGQEELSNRFAQSGTDKFAGSQWSTGTLGSPVLAEHAAVFECSTRHQYEGGDHIILVGEVHSFDAREEAPLLFHGGRYAERRPRPHGEQAEAVDMEHGRFTDDFLFYLIARAYFQTSLPAREKLAQQGLTQEEYLALAMLSMNAPAKAEKIAEQLAHTGFVPSAEQLDTLAQREILIHGGSGYELSEKGEKHLIETLAIGKAFESDLAEHFTSGEIAETKRVLRRIIELTGGDVPIGWRD